MKPIEIINTIAELKDAPNLVTLYFRNELKIPLITKVHWVDIVYGITENIITVRLSTTLSNKNDLHIVSTLLNILLESEYRVEDYYISWVTDNGVVFYIHKKIIMEDKQAELSWEEAIQSIKDKEALNKLDQEKELMEYEESNEADSRKTVENEIDDWC